MYTRVRNFRMKLYRDGCPEYLENTMGFLVLLHSRTQVHEIQIYSASFCLRTRAFSKTTPTESDPADVERGPRYMAYTGHAVYV